MKPAKVELHVGRTPIIIETGQVAEQANGAVLASCGESVILATAVAEEKPREGIDFLPLICDFEEKLYAAGRIPGGYIKREGRPSEYAILCSRMIDRPVRPLFPEGYFLDTQVTALPLSSDRVVPLDVLAVNAASAALSVSDIPFQGPIGCVRVGREDGRLVVNPSYPQMEKSDLDLVVAGLEDAIIMVECRADQVGEEVLLQALELAQGEIARLVAGIRELQSKVGMPKRTVEPPKSDEDLFRKICEELRAPYEELVLKEMSKKERDRAIATLVEGIQETLRIPDEGMEDFKALVYKAEKKIYREIVLDKKRRLNGRQYADIRPIDCKVGLLPRAHGSGLFTRGETQVLTITTLGSLGEEQMLDDLQFEESRRYMHQYNFPPYSVGEVRPHRAPGRREIGHGALASKALEHMIPDEKAFPYAMRLVSEVLSSDGSTSMASTCGSTLSLMDAGVPIKAPVAGIAMGLIKEGDRYAILSDIQGMEDALGDMDFKVAGTERGVTALQMDIKIKGISSELMRQALAQAREGRLHILEKMLSVIREPRPSLSAYAPRVTCIQIPQDTIGLLIGPGGKTIRKITDETGVKIDIEDNGDVYVTAPTEEQGALALQMIRDLTREVRPGETFTGKVVRILPQKGAIVEILPGKDGLLHISELAWEHVRDVEDVVKVGDEVEVKVVRVEESGNMRLSRKALLEAPPRQETREGRPRYPDGTRPDRPRRSHGRKPH